MPASPWQRQESSKQTFQTLKQSSPIIEMLAGAVPTQQSKTVAIGRPVGDARVEMGFGNLLFGGTNRIRPSALDLIFPSREPRMWKPFAQAGDDFFRGDQL